MSGPEDVSDEDYQKGLDALSSLISGRVRADGKNWSHAFDMMKVYLEASYNSLNATLYIKYIKDIQINLVIHQTLSCSV